MIPHSLGDAGDAFALPFLDLHYFQNNSSGGAGGGGVSSLTDTTGTAVHLEARQGLALSALATRILSDNGLSGPLRASRCR